MWYAQCIVVVIQIYPLLTVVYLNLTDCYYRKSIAVNEEARLCPYSSEISLGSSDYNSERAPRARWGCYTYFSMR